MRWEDQELNFRTGAEFPEIVYAHIALLNRAEKVRSYFVRVDQQVLDEMLADGRIGKMARGARIDRLCLYYRLTCRLGPGGDDYPSLGTVHYWGGSDLESLYGIVYISPRNDWINVMVVSGEAPILSPERAN